MTTPTRVLEVFVTLVGLYISCVEFISAQKYRKAFPLGLSVRRLQFISPVNIISLLRDKAGHKIVLKALQTNLRSVNSADKDGTQFSVLYLQPQLMETRL